MHHHCLNLYYEPKVLLGVLTIVYMLWSKTGVVDLYMYDMFGICNFYKTVIITCQLVIIRAKWERHKTWVFIERDVWLVAHNSFLHA